MNVVVRGATLVGIDAVEVEVEAQLQAGSLPGIRIVGLPDGAVRESRDRVKAAIRAFGFDFPRSGVLINLAPAHLRKSGPSFDLPIALAILAATEQIPTERLRDLLVTGELALNGTIRPVRGLLSMLLLAHELGLKGVLGAGTLAGTPALPEVPLLAPATLREAALYLAGRRELAPVVAAGGGEPESAVEDLAEVRGQEGAKRALIAAAAGGHHALLVGPPGSGKTMLCQRFPGLLPDLSPAQALEVARVHGAAGLTARGRRPPLRAPHDTASYAGLVGGGNPPLPGEITLAHRGVLFLDEVCEFSRQALETLRGPLEEGRISLSRAGAQMSFPAAFQLLAAMNPCPCGQHGARRGSCSCTDSEVRRYRERLSGPLLDRIDLRIDMEATDVQALGELPAGPSTLAARALVERAREIQAERYAGLGFATNAALPSRLLRTYCPLAREAEQTLIKAIERHGLSARTYARVLRVARTLADLRGASEITRSELIQALSYRGAARAEPP